MSVNLTDIANFAQVASLPLSILLWLFTRETFGVFWNKWQKWIFGGCLIVVLGAFYRLGWLKWLFCVVSWPVWRLLIVAIAIPAVQLIVQQATKILRAPKLVKQFHWKQYVCDEIFGVEWRWTYRHDELNDVIGAFCPAKQCKCRLTVREDPHGWVYPQPNPPTVMSCPHCGFERRFNETYTQLTNNVVVEVERRINTTEFQQRMAQRDA